MTQTLLDLDIPSHLRGEFVFQTVGIHPPNGILFGFNTIKKVGEEAKKLGASHALLVADEVMERLGYIEIVKDEMEQKGIRVEVFARVNPEPQLSTADALYGVIQKTDYDLVVGLGGGSPMDMAKLTAIMITNKQEPFELLQKKVVAKPAVSKILIPTTAGTGSEVSRHIVVSKGNEKYFLVSAYAHANIAIVDPSLMTSMPPNVTASTGIDALSHAIDSIMHKLANPLYDSLAVGGIELIARFLRRATSDGQDLEARYYMAMAATMSMMAFNCIGGLYSHSASYALSMFQPMAHGIGCGLALPLTMAFNLPMVEEKLSLVAHAMGERTDLLCTKRAAQRAAEMVYELMTEVRMPVSLEEIGFKHEDISKAAEVCITRYPRVYNPRPMSMEQSLALFESMWKGKISYF